MARDRRQHDLVERAPLQRRRHHRRRRIGAHAAGVGTLVAVEGALVVLRGGERQRVLAVAQREEGGFLAVEEFLDDDLRPAAPSAPANISRSRPRPRRVVAATTTPLPAASPSALTTIGAAIRRT